MTKSKAATVMHTLACVVAALLAWKIVRTDWTVVAPYWYHDSDPPASDHYGPYRVPLPTSPLWRPPQPHEVDPSDTTQWSDPLRNPSPNRKWESFYPGGGAWGITGPPRLHPDWTIITYKLIGGFIVLLPLAFLLSYVARWITRLAAPTSTPNGHNA